MDKIQRVLVTGAAGGLGSAISNLLSEAGYEVACLIRPEDSAATLKVREAHIYRGYIEDAEAVGRALEGSQAAINCAALLPGARHLGHEAFRRVNVRGALNLLAECGKQNVNRAIFFSTISVVDHIGRHITQEQLAEFAPDANDPYQHSKVEMEQLLEEKSKSYGGALVILRPAFVYGPGNFSVWSDALQLLRASKMVLLDGGKAFFPLVYSDDIARFVLHLLRTELTEPSFQRFVLASPQPTLMRDVFHYLADFMGVARPRSMPASIAWALALGAEMVPARFRKGRLKLLTKARVLQYSKGYDISGVLKSPPLGFVCGTDYKAGFTEMLRDQKSAARE
jgi:nucleoside-diphosphate-sugar epimerase